MKAIITIGCSASGKSTWAATQANFVDVNRDEFRKQVLTQKHLNCGGRNMWSLWNFKWEKEVDKLVEVELQKCHKFMENIIISDTNLNVSRRQNLAQKLRDLGYSVEYKIFGIDLTIDELWERDEKRVHTVGRDVIAKQYEKFRKEFPKYQLKDVEGRLPTILYDIDGTLAHMDDKRGPFDWGKVGVDSPDAPLFLGLIAQYVAGYEIKIMSGRDEVCRKETINWLDKYLSKFSNMVFEKDIQVHYELFMRKKDDMRADTIVKEELFFAHIDGNYNVSCVYDDRPKVCHVWRDMGFKVNACGNPYIHF